MSLRRVSLQIFTGNHAPTALVPQVATTLSQWVSRDNFVPLTEPTLPPHRSLLLFPNHRWFGVYDEFIEGMQHELLHELATILSNQLQLYVLVIMFDDGPFELSLYQNGVRLDTYSNEPAHFTRLSSDNSPTGQPELWQPVLLPPATPADLRAVWDRQNEWGQTIIEETFVLLGLAQGQAFDSLRHRASEGGEISGFTRLDFLNTRQAELFVRAEGLPELECNGGLIGITPTVGEELNFHVQTQNNGGEAVGLKLVIWGEAISQKLIELERVMVALTPEGSLPAYGTGHAPPPQMVEYPLEPVELSTGEVGYYLEVEDFTIPAGLAHQDYNRRETTFIRWHNAMSSAEITFYPKGKAVAVGTGRLNFGFVPLANPEAGQASWQLPLTVLTAPPIRPLKASPQVRASELHVLTPVDKVFAMVALARPVAEFSQELAGVIEAWHDLIRPLVNSSYQLVYQEDTNERPQVEELASVTLAGSAIWQNIRNGASSFSRFTGEIQSNEGDLFGYLPANRQGGFALVTSPYWRVSDLEIVPYLAFWFNLKGFTKAEAIAFEEALGALVDRVVVASGALQALVANWEWRFSAESYIDNTPYEQACGIQGNTTGYHFWTSRYLRGISDRLWLGQNLLAQLGVGEETLASVAEVTTNAAGWQLKLREGKELAELEKLLAPLLPEAPIWQKVVQELYKKAYGGNPADS